MKRVIAAIVLMLTAPCVWAAVEDGTPEFSWSWPITVTAEEIDNIDFVTIYCRDVAVGPSGEFELVQREAVPMNYTHPEDGAFDRGERYRCSMDATDLAGDTSQRSNEVSFDMPLLSPPAATVLRIASTPTRTPSFDWDPVTTREDGSPVTVDRYLMQCTPPITPAMKCAARPEQSKKAGLTIVYVVTRSTTYRMASLILASGMTPSRPSITSPSGNTKTIVGNQRT